MPVTTRHESVECSLGAVETPADVAISTTFGINVLKSFSVTTREVDGHIDVADKRPMVA